MTTHRRPTLVLGGSFLLWLPVLPGFLDGQVDAATAGVRYAVALALAWVAVAGLTRLLRGYASGVAEAGDAPPSASPATASRRWSDDPAARAETPA